MRLLRRHFRRFSGKSAPFLPEPALEDVYRRLFTRDLATMGVRDDLYPTGGAANYSLLYLILRVARDLRPASVLDIGAGQTSLLWNMLCIRGLVDSVITLEHDQKWADEIGRQVDHDILVTPLRAVRIGAVQTYSYDWSAVQVRGPFDVVICDGPTGVPHFSRYGVLATLEERMPTDFALVLDDAERPGEQDTIGAIHDRFRQLGRSYSTGIVRAAKTQMVFATGAYVGICNV